MRILFSLLFVIIGVYASGQPADVSAFPEIRITISRGQMNNLLQSKGEKMVMKNPVMMINREAAEVKEIHSRGNNSLTFEHKSLSVDLQKGITIEQQGKKVKVKKFDLMNLVMDKDLWHNRWAFLNMNKLDIFPLFNTFCTLWINDQPQGIYLLVEKPRHYTTGEAKSPYMIRRGPEHNIDGDYVDTENKDEVKRYKKQFQRLYEDINKYKGEELYHKLSTGLYLEHYFDWMAFNYLIMNGDYMDELYLYIRPETGKFDIIPWDYDDIIRPAPHEGAKERLAVAGLKKRLVFSGEDPLDRAIGSDDFVNGKYETEFIAMLKTLPAEHLQATADQVLSELTALSQDGASAQASLYLGKEPFVIGQATDEMRRSIDFIISRYTAIRRDFEKK